MFKKIILMSLALIIVLILMGNAIYFFLSSRPQNLDETNKVIDIDYVQLKLNDALKYVLV